jgi:hypothetical protein
MLKPTEEPLEPGKKRRKVAKKKTPGKKVSPKKEASEPKIAVKEDILKGVNYELIEVTGSAKVTEQQSHLLTFKRNDKTYKRCLFEKPDERAILNYWNNLK